MAAAESATRRTLTDAECAVVLAHSCPAPVDVPENLRLRDGLDTYARPPPARGAGRGEDHALREPDGPAIRGSSASSSS